MKLWFCFYSYVCFYALFIQFIFLPYLAPGLHAGHGLMHGGDWLNFHDVAVYMANLIREKGWSQWVLRPGGRFAIESGVASAIYAVTTPEPWVLIPFSAFFQATSAFLIVKILKIALQVTEKTAVLATLPFLLLPSSTVWTAMIHKDGVAMLGIVLFLYCWIRFQYYLENNRSNSSLKPLFATATGSFFLLIAGVTCCLFARPYWVFFMIVFGYFYTAWITAESFICILRKQISLKTFTAILLISLFFGTSVNFFNKSYQSFGRPYPMDFIDQQQKSKPVNSERAQKLRPHSHSVPLKDEVIPGFGLKPSDLLEQQDWKETTFLPRFVERQLYSIAEIRDGFARDWTAGTNIDANIRFHSVYDFIRYFPRALAIVLFAPFPEHWSGETMVVKTNSTLRKIVGAEMALFYLSLPFIIWGLWANRRKTIVWWLSTFCFTTALVYAYSVPNAGALHRFRYLSMTFMWGFGLAYAIKQVGMSSAFAFRRLVLNEKVS